MEGKKQVYVAVDKTKKLFYYDGDKYIPVLDEKGGEGGDITLKTINGESLKGEGNIEVVTERYLKTINGESLVGRDNIEVLADGDLKTINGESIVGEGDLEITLPVFHWVGTQILNPTYPASIGLAESDDSYFIEKELTSEELAQLKANNKFYYSTGNTEPVTFYKTSKNFFEANYFNNVFKAFFTDEEQGEEYIPARLDLCWIPIFRSANIEFVLEMEGYDEINHVWHMDDSFDTTVFENLSSGLFQAFINGESESSTYGVWESNGNTLKLSFIDGRILEGTITPTEEEGTDIINIVENKPEKIVEINLEQYFDSQELLQMFATYQTYETTVKVLTSTQTLDLPNDFNYKIKLVAPNIASSFAFLLSPIGKSQAGVEFNATQYVCKVNESREPIAIVSKTLTLWENNLNLYIVKTDIPTQSE